MRLSFLIALFLLSTLSSYASECVNHVHVLKTEVIPDSLEFSISVTQVTLGDFSFSYDSVLGAWVFRESHKRIGFYDPIKKTWSSFELGDSKIIMGEKDGSILNMESVEGLYGTYSKFRKALERDITGAKSRMKPTPKALTPVNPFAALSPKDFQINILADTVVVSDPMENTQIGKIATQNWNAGIIEIVSKKNKSKIRITSSVGAEDFASEDGMGYKRHPLQGYQVVSLIDATGSEKSSLRVLRPVRILPKEEKKADALELKDKYYFTIGCGRVTPLSNANTRSPNSVQKPKKK